MRFQSLAEQGGSHGTNFDEHNPRRRKFRWWMGLLGRIFSHEFLDRGLVGRNRRRCKLFYAFRVNAVPRRGSAFRARTFSRSRLTK
jgi:hypothetical protein